MYKVKEIPEEERPRERLRLVGAQNLSNQELLAIILKTGTKSKNVKELALDILKKCPDISNLKDLNYNKLTSIKGIGTVKAIELLASVELGKRIFLEGKNINKKKLTTAQDIYLYSKSLFYNKKQEYFYCIYFNHKQEVLEKKLLFIGTINKSVVHPREIFKEAYLLSASTIVCLHNHPSNDVTPSKEDIIFTNTLVEIGKIQGISVIDHIIVGNNKYYSFYENHNILNI